MSDPGSLVLVDKEAGIATVTLNRPEAMNALSHELRRKLVQTFRELAGDGETSVVILTGAGRRAFCAGLDLKELGGETSDGGRSDARAPGAVGEDGDALIDAIERFPRPIIGAINGVAITGGFELALACDVLIASENARFADTHARVGIMPGWGLSQKLPRLIGVFRAKELSLTGNFLSAARAEAWGLVNRVVSADRLLEACRALARDMQSCDPEMVAAYKRVIDDGLAGTLAAGRQLEVERNREHAGNVSAEKIAARRKAITERGRAQSISAR